MDLFQERRDIAREIISTGHSVLMSEAPQGFPVSPFLTIISNCFDAIKHHSDILVLVISSRYGSISSPGKSITQDEYRKAKQLGLPIYVFVKKSVNILLPIFNSSPQSNFSPVVEDNRVLEFLSEIVSDEYGWIFEFEDVNDILETLKFQISCLFKSILDRRSEPSGELIYTYTNNYTTLLREDGLCVRKLEYEILNDTDTAITRVSLGDASDIPFNSGDEMFQAFGDNSTNLKYEYIIQNPGYRRWDILLNDPLPPNSKVRFHCSYLSGDLGAMDTGHQRTAEHGLITYFWPRSLVNSIKSISIRNDNDILNLSTSDLVYEGHNFLMLSYMFRNLRGRWRFKVSWD